jgi:hypothetical protein
MKGRVGVTVALLALHLKVDSPLVGTSVICGGGGGPGSPMPPRQYFFYLRIDFWLLSCRAANKKIGVRVGERGVCTQRTGSKQSSPSF